MEVEPIAEFFEKQAAALGAGVADLPAAAGGEKIAAPSPATSSTPKPTRGGVAWRFVGTRLAAEECGVDVKTVQNFVKEGKREEAAGRANPVPMKLGHSGEWTVQAGAIFEWAHERVARGLSTRLPKGLRAPAGYEAGGVNPAPPAPPERPRAVDLSDGILKAVLAGVLTIEQAKVALAEKETDRRGVDSEDRRQAKVPRDDVVKMLRSLGEVYCATIEANATARATALVRTVRDVIGRDLKEENAGAIQILAAAECRWSNEHEIPAIQTAVRDQVNGVLLLEGMA